MRDEVERYGHYSLAAESMYDHPFQWGSKRTGPDLARVGGKYSDAWHVEHMTAPRSIVPGSVMPGYPFLAERKLDSADIAARMQALQAGGRALHRRDDRQGEGRSRRADQSGCGRRQERLGALSEGAGAQVRRRSPPEPTELDALISYLQMLGTLVDFTKFDEAGPNLR